MRNLPCKISFTMLAGINLISSLYNLKMMKNIYSAFNIDATLEILDRSISDNNVVSSTDVHYYNSTNEASRRITSETNRNRQEQINHQKPSQNITEGSKRQREQLYFVVHVGPPKTATTTLQTVLTMWQSPQSSSLNVNNSIIDFAKDIYNKDVNITSLLSLDNYVYAGTFLDGKENDVYLESLLPLFNAFVNTLFYESTDLTQTNFIKNSLVQSKTNVKTNNSSGSFCDSNNDTMWDQFSLLFEEHRGKNIIISGEGISIQIQDFNDSNGIALDWCGLQRVLGQDYKLVIVVGYRRHVDWVPSAKQQLERYTVKKPLMQRWPSNNGRVVGPLFPKYAFSRWFVYPSTDTVVRILKKQQHQMDNPIIKIFNLHQRYAGIKTLPTAFFCHVLPNAPNVCKLSKQFDAKRLVDVVANPEQPITYDRLACAAEEAGLINNTYMVSRHGLAMELQQFHAKIVLGNDTTATSLPISMTNKDLPLLCPSRKQLEQYLKISLDMEARLLPEFAASEQGAEQHITQFWSNVKKNKYCSVDVDAIMQHNETWRSVVTSYETKLVEIKNNKLNSNQRKQKRRKLQYVNVK